MSDNSSAISSGISLETLLGVVFIILKLTENIDWPWIWVLSPFWIPLVFVLIALAAIAIVFLITSNKA